MQGAQLRWLILAGVLAGGIWLQATIGQPPPPGAARWPVADALYAAPNWTAGPATVEAANDVSFVSRNYAHREGTSATLVLATSPEAKRIYRAGADVPYLGSGYTIGPSPDSLIPTASGLGAFVARREDRAWLVMHTAGERRGLAGHGALRWAPVVLDAALGRPNDYYRVSLTIPFERPDAPAVREAVTLASTVFPRLVAWYAG